MLMQAELLSSSGVYPDTHGEREGNCPQEQSVFRWHSPTRGTAALPRAEQKSQVSLTQHLKLFLQVFHGTASSCQAEKNSPLYWKWSLFSHVPQNLLKFCGQSIRHTAISLQFNTTFPLEFSLQKRNIQFAAGLCTHTELNFNSNSTLPKAKYNWHTAALELSVGMAVDWGSPCFYTDMECHQSHQTLLWRAARPVLGDAEVLS